MKKSVTVGATLSKESIVLPLRTRETLAVIAEKIADGAAIVAVGDQGITSI
jgi:hypothetical protein